MVIVHAIGAINWDNVPTAHLPQWIEPSGTLLAIWPSPVDHDVCFANAGFSEFADSDEPYDAEWKQMLERLLDALARFGEMRLENKDRPRLRATWWDCLRWWRQARQPRQPSAWAIVDRLLVSIEDDR